MSTRMSPRVYVTTRTDEVFAIAHDLAATLGHDDVTPVHILLAMLREGRSVAVAALHSRGVSLGALERELEQHLPPVAAPHVVAEQLSWTPSDEHVLEHAVVEARALGTEFFGCEHLLLAFLRDTTSVPARILAQHGVRFGDAQAQVLRVYGARPESGTSAGPSPAV